MKFTPKTKEEAEAGNILKVDSCQYEVLEATDKISKSGNEMIEMKIALYLNGERKAVIFDYMLEALAYKLRHFCETNDLMQQYNDGTLEAADCVGKAGDCKLGIQPAANGYPAKNIIKDYIESNPAAKPSTTDDDIPY